MRISDWSSDVCSSDLAGVAAVLAGRSPMRQPDMGRRRGRRGRRQRGGLRSLDQQSAGHLLFDDQFRLDPQGPEFSARPDVAPDESGEYRSLCTGGGRRTLAAPLSMHPTRRERTSAGKGKREAVSEEYGG